MIIIPYYTNQKFLEVYRDTMHFLYDVFETDKLIDLYAKFMLSDNKDIDSEIAYLKAALTKVNDEWEIQEFGVHIEEFGEMSLAEMS